MAFTPTNELERLLVAASTNEAARPAFLEALVELELFLIKQGPPPEKPEVHVAGENTMVELALIEIKGKVYVPVFTSVERISAIVPANVAYVSAKGRDVLTMLKGQEVVMNPGAEYGKFFTPSEIEALLKGNAVARDDVKKVTATEPAATKPALAQPALAQPALGQPAELPRHLTQPLMHLFARQPKVNAAYLAQIFVAGSNEPPHTLIGLDITGDWTDIRQAADEAVRAAAKIGEKVDIIRVWPEDRNEPIADYMLRETQPFYQGRKKWLGLF